MSEEKKQVFTVVSCGRDEYPGDGLRLVAGDPATNRFDAQLLDKHFLHVMGVPVQEGDEVEITARVISRVVTERRPVDG